MAKYDVFKHLMKTGGWDDLVNFSMLNFYNRRYSLYNCGLILLQKPGATIVQSDIRWQQQNREIKPQAIPIVILQPNGPVALAYDYSDTYGEKDIDEYSKENLEMEYNNRRVYTLDDESYSYYIHKLKLSGIDYEERAYGERYGGNISAHEYANKLYLPKFVRRHEKPVEVESYFTISINSTYSAHKKFLTLLHELGHLYCGHIKGGKKTKENKLTEYERYELDNNQAEYEAEMVCKLICDRYCIANLESDSYLSEHNVNGKMPHFGMTEVIVAEDRVADILRLR